MVVKKRALPKGGGRGKRGPDKKPRKVNPKSIANLKTRPPWKPGETGNPRGRPPVKMDITAIAKEILEQPVDWIFKERKVEAGDFDGWTTAQFLALQWVQTILVGDPQRAFRYQKELLDRLEGRPPEVIETHNTSPQTAEEALARYVDLDRERKRILGELDG